MPGKNEIEDAKNIQAISITNKDRALNIMELAGVIKKSIFVIANDTGPSTYGSSSRKKWGSSYLVITQHQKRFQ